MDLHELVFFEKKKRGNSRPRLAISNSYPVRAIFLCYVSSLYMYIHISLYFYITKDSTNQENFSLRTYTILRSLSYSRLLRSQNSVAWIPNFILKIKMRDPGIPVEDLAKLLIVLWSEKSNRDAPIFSQRSSATPVAKP